MTETSRKAATKYTRKRLFDRYRYDSIGFLRLSLFFFDLSLYRWQRRRYKVENLVKYDDRNESLRNNRRIRDRRTFCRWFNLIFLPIDPFTVVDWSVVSYSIDLENQFVVFLTLAKILTARISVLCCNANAFKNYYSYITIRWVLSSTVPTIS